jgi:hypothetical protein
MSARGIDCLVMMSNGYLSSANFIYVANYIDILHGVVVFALDGQPTVFALAYSFAAQANVGREATSPSFMSSVPNWLD